MNLKGTHKAIVVTIAVLIGLTIIGKFVAGYKNVQKGIVSPLPENQEFDEKKLPGRFVFSADFRRDFMDSCTYSNDVTYSYCECTLDYYGENFGVEKSEEIASRSAQTGETQPETWEATYACQEKLL